MKINYLLLIFSFPFLSYGQFSENFSDGDFTQNPTWQGDSESFIVSNSGELQSRGPSAASSIYLSTPYDKLENTQWEFLIKYGFEPSTSNYSRFYLSSDSSNLEGPLHGYFIKLGGEAGTTDKIELYKQNGTVSSLLIQGATGRAGNAINTIRIKVIRDEAGNWQLFSDAMGNTNYTLEGTAFDNSFKESQWCGWVCIHSSTRKDLFFLDDVLISDAPLQLSQVKASGDSSISIRFNNPLNSATALLPLNYSLNATLLPEKIELANDAKSVILHFPIRLTNGNYNLHISDISDTSGSLLSGIFPCFLQKPLAYGDLIVTEIYFDPSPSNGLPEEEYIELYNTTDDTIYLNKFNLSDPLTKVTFPNVKHAPHSYLIVCPEAAGEDFIPYGHTLAVNPWPSLTNSGDLLILKDDENRILFHISYSPSWHEDEKSEGGWSLEMKNLSSYCLKDLNWSSSTHPTGGTPGAVNSIYTSGPEVSAPEVKSWNLSDSSTIEIFFNKPIDTLLSINQFFIAGNKVIEAKASGNRITIQLEQHLQQNEVISIELIQIRDCIGNSAASQILEIVRPAIEDSPRILLNEVLFNPKSGGDDFVEIYNHSPNYIDLQNWKVGSIDQNGNLTTTFIATVPLIVKPFSYLALSPSPELLKTAYPIPIPEKIRETPLPGFYDDQGTIVLLSANGKTIDRFSYLEEYHSPLLKDREGVSLERISFSSPTQSEYNWNSASAGSGHATPGYQNSQYLEDKAGKSIQVEPKVISPNGDNYQDMAYIHYQFQETGNICNIRIFNSEGRMVNHLIKNFLTGADGFFYWDGTNEKGELVNTGMYILCLETFGPGGTSSTWKTSLAVARDY